MTAAPAEQIWAPPEPDPRRWVALAFIALAQLMIALDATIVSIALPSAQSALGASDADRQWVVTAYTLAFGGLLLLGGRIADYVGRKRAFMIGLAGFALASVAGGAAPDFGVLIAARSAQGAFAALDAGARHRLACGTGRPAGPVRGPRSAHAEPSAPAAHRGRPQSRRRIPGRGARAGRHVRRVPLPDLRLPGRAPLHAPRRRPSVPSDHGRLAIGLVADRSPAHAAGPPASPDGSWGAGGRGRARAADPAPR